MTKLKMLYAQKAKKFDEICALVARELGYGELPTMSDEDRNQVEDEAEQYVKQWEETVEMRTSRACDGGVWFRAGGVFSARSDAVDPRGSSLGS
jgi:hypothetical protein